MTYFKALHHYLLVHTAQNMTAVTGNIRDKIRTWNLLKTTKLTHSVERTKIYRHIQWCLVMGAALGHHHI